MIPYRTLLERASEMPDKVAFISKEAGEVTFEQLALRARQLAKGLVEAGLGKGDVIGTILPNCMEMVEIYVAASAIGAVFQPLDLRFQGDELRNTLLNTDVKALFCHFSRTNAEIEDVVPNGVKKVAVGGKRPRWIDYQRMFGSTEGDLRPPEVNEDEEIALFLYTSGSTSGIKCVPVTWRQLDFFPTDLINTWGAEIFARGISLLPWSHISGPIVINLCLVSGNSYVIRDGFSPEGIVGDIERYRVTWTHTVPSVARLILRANLEGRDMSSFRFIALMGTSVPVSLLKELESRIPSAVAIQGYGLTETSPLITLETPEDHERKIGSIGRQLEGIEIRLVDQQGRDVPIGEPGEIIVRGPKVFSGYYGNEQLTKRVIREGWFHTGDVARRDEDGFYYHLGRLDDLIITGGLNVFPAEVEAAALTYPGIKDAVAYPREDKRKGQVICLDVCPYEGTSIDVAMLRRHMRKHLAEYKIPREIHVVKEILYTPTGKPVRMQV